VNDLVGQGNAMRVVQTLEALRKVADPLFGAAAVVVGGGDLKPPWSTLEKKAESFIPATAVMTEASTLDPFIVKGISGVLGSLCFLVSFLPFSLLSDLLI